MESFFLRYRNLLVLLAILLAQIIGLAVQVRRADNGRSTLDPGDAAGVRLIRLWADAVVTPPEKFFHGSKLGAVSLWQNYMDLRHVREQNQDLQKTIDRLRLEQAALLEDAKQGARLQTLMDFQQKYIYKTLAAQAIGSSGSDSSRVFYIDKGKNYGLESDMAVITADGIVGKVREVYPRTAQVLAVNDQTSGAGVILEATRTRGILRGNAAGVLEVVDILADKRIQKGDKVLTAGGDQIFPRGLPVGVVDKIVPDPQRDSFIDVIVTPAAHIDRLDEVLVVTSTEPRFNAQDQQDIATSQALKGPEAAAISEQKKASEIMAERLPGLVDPNLPPDQQPAHDGAAPVVVPHPPPALHPDRFSPGSSTNATPNGGTSATPVTQTPAEPESIAPAKQNKPAKTSNPSAPTPVQPQPNRPQANKPQRNP